MNKKFYFLITILLLFTTVSCATLPVDSISNESSYENDNLSDDQVTDYDIYIHWFENKITNNPVDNRYNYDFENGDKNISTLVVDYVNGWRDEFNHAKNTISLFFTTDETTKILNILRDWESSLSNSWKWEFEYLFDNSLSTYGTAVYYDEFKKIGDEYREKTIWLKYLLFVKETDLNSDNYNDSLKSIEWHLSQ